MVIHRNAKGGSRPTNVFANRPDSFPGGLAVCEALQQNATGGPNAARILSSRRTIQVSTGPRLLTGRCLGIDDSGSLVLQTEGGREEVASGTVRSIS